MSEKGAFLLCTVNLGSLGGLFGASYRPSLPGFRGNLSNAIKSERTKRAVAEQTNCPNAENGHRSCGMSPKNKVAITAEPAMNKKARLISGNGRLGIRET